MQQLTRFGRVGESIRLVEHAAAQALRARRDRPHLGGIPPDPAHRQPVPIFPTRIGYVQYVDMAALSRVLKNRTPMLDVVALPGTFVHLAAPLAYVDAAMQANDKEVVRKAFLVDDDRSWEQDPRFGLSVLAEIGSKSLPPTAADYGTAIAVIGAAVRVLANWMPDDNVAPEPDHPRVRVPALSTDDLLDDIFHPLAREGAGIVQVPVHLQKALAALTAMAPDQFEASARRVSQVVTDHATVALLLPAEKATVEVLTLR
jgi:uncharacterized membrane protein